MKNTRFDLLSHAKTRARQNFYHLMVTCQDLDFGGEESVIKTPARKPLIKIEQTVGVVRAGRAQEERRGKGGIRKSLFLIRPLSLMNGELFLLRRSKKGKLRGEIEPSLLHFDVVVNGLLRKVCERRRR